MSTASNVLRLLCAAMLGVAAAALISCGSSGKGLIPVQNAAPLQNDFDAVAQAAQTGNGNCAATAAAIRQTEHDFSALPATIDRGLHARLGQGIENLRKRALGLCTEPLILATTTTGAPSTASTQTTPTTATDTSTQTTSTATVTAPNTTPTTTLPTGAGGGAAAPGDSNTGTSTVPAGAGAGGGGAAGGNAPGGAGGASPGTGGSANGCAGQ